MRAVFVVVAVFLVSPAAFAAEADDAALASFLRRSPESVSWAQKRCGDALKPAASVSALSQCAKGRLRRLLADSEKMQEADDAEGANPYVPSESWNRLNAPGPGQERDDERDPGTMSSEF